MAEQRFADGQKLVAEPGGPDAGRLDSLLSLVTSHDSDSREQVRAEGPMAPEPAVLRQRQRW